MAPPRETRVDQRRRVPHGREKQRAPDVRAFGVAFNDRARFGHIAASDGSMKICQRRSRSPFVKLLAVARFDFFKSAAIVQLRPQNCERLPVSDLQEAHHRGLARFMNFLNGPRFSKVVE
jgi:hypothetical protein